MSGGGGRWQPLRRALAWSVVALLVDVGGAFALDAADVADRLLSAGAGALALLPLVLLFLAARLGLYLVAPGMLLRGVVLGLGDARARLDRG